MPGCFGRPLKERKREVATLSESKTCLMETSHLLTPKEFQNWSDFEIYDAAIRAGLRVGEIVPVEEPAWYIPPTSEIGHAACFQRLDDSSIWVVLLPERVSCGYWKKLSG